MLSKSSTDTQKSKKALLVEDDKICQTIHLHYLNTMGYEVKIADTYKIAENILNETLDFDLILTDIGLPDGDGRDLIVLIRRKEMETQSKKKMPIFVNTAYSDPKIKEACLNQLGADAFFLKPIQLKELINEAKRMNIA